MCLWIQQGTYKLFMGQAPSNYSKFSLGWNYHPVFFYPVSCYGLPPFLDPMVCPHKIWHLAVAHKYVHHVQHILHFTQKWILFLNRHWLQMEAAHGMHSLKRFSERWTQGSELFGFSRLIDAAWQVHKVVLQIWVCTFKGFDLCKIIKDVLHFTILSS